MYITHLNLWNIIKNWTKEKGESKLWDVKQGAMSWNPAWKRTTTNNYWVWPNGPQQKSNLK
jgi:hypothetical protein